MSGEEGVSERSNIFNLSLCTSLFVCESNKWEREKECVCLIVCSGNSAIIIIIVNFLFTLVGSLWKGGEGPCGGLTKLLWLGIKQTDKQQLKTWKRLLLAQAVGNLLELTTRLIHWQQTNETRYIQQYARTPAHCQRGWCIRNEIRGILLFDKQVRKSQSGLAHLRTWAKIDEDITLCKSNKATFLNWWVTSPHVSVQS